MKKIILSVGLILLASVVFDVQAQSINNKNWKAYLAEPFNDTLTFHIQSDSSFVTLSTGEVLLKINCKIIGEVLTLTDYNTGQYSCPDATGKYKINLSGDSFTLKLIEDPCEGRARSLDGLKWVKASK